MGLDVTCLHARTVSRMMILSVLRSATLNTHEYSLNTACSFDRSKFIVSEVEITFFGELVVL